MNTVVSLLLALSATLPVVNGQHEGMPKPGVIDTFRWTYPFGEGQGAPAGFEPNCEAAATFRASQHALRDLQKPPPIGLSPWAEALKYFFGGRPYPGSWDGIDMHQGNRDVIMMEYRDVPEPVKDWIEEQQKDKSGDGRFLFGVYEKPKSEDQKIKKAAAPRTSPTADDKGEDKVLLFAAGALHEILPLLVAKGSSCEDDLLDLAKYKAAPEDGGVIAWPTERSLPDWEGDTRDITFTVKAQVLKKVSKKEGKDEL